MLSGYDSNKIMKHSSQFFLDITEPTKDYKYQIDQKYKATVKFDSDTVITMKTTVTVAVC